LERKKGFVICRSEPFEKMVYSYQWDGSSPLVIDELGLTITAERIKRLPRSSDFDDKERAYFDGNAVPFPLHIRNRQDGDRYRPLGAPGHKKLKEIMRAKSIPLADREKRPVFLSGEEIIWVLGLPVAEKLKVSGGTKKVLALCVIPHGQR
jgi:tRNA(Ile)-lysidine synthase